MEPTPRITALYLFSFNVIAMQAVMSVNANDLSYSVLRSQPHLRASSSVPLCQVPTLGSLIWKPTGDIIPPTPNLCPVPPSGIVFLMLIFRRPKRSELTSGLLSPYFPISSTNPCFSRDVELQ